MGLWTKIKFTLGAIIVALIPLFYALGIRRGNKNSHADRMEDVAKQNEQIAGFYRDLGELNEEIDTPRNRHELVDRVRNEGL